MFVADCFDVNEKGHLTIGGCDTVGLAKEYGTPLYVMDEMTIRQACRLYQKSFQENYDGHGMAFYASKALNCKELCRIVAEEGLGLGCGLRRRVIHSPKGRIRSGKDSFPRE